MSKAKQQKQGERNNKEKISRASRRQRKEAKNKRKFILIAVLLIGVVLAAGGIFNLPYINVARRGGEWLADKITASPGKAEKSPQYLFLTPPLGGTALSGDVSALFAIYKGSGQEREIMDMTLLTYNTDSKQGEIYILSETAAAFNASGQKVDLSQALKNEGGIDLLRNTVGNISGLNVDYLVLLGFDGTVQMFQDLGLPPLVLMNSIILKNPVSGDTSHLSKGQEIGDADRLVSYLLAYDVAERRDARLERARGYIPEALYALKGKNRSQLEESLSSMGGELTLNPASKSPAEDQMYLASMIQAFAALDANSLAVKAIPKVEVLNGCGVPDLGKKIGDQLTSFGVPLAGTGGNAKVTVDGQEFNDFSHQKSTIIYRRDDPRVKAYAKYLGVLMSVEEVTYDSSPGPDIVFITGKDKA